MPDRSTSPLPPVAAEFRSLEGRPQQRLIALKVALFFFGTAGGLLLLEGLLRIYNPFYVRIKGDRIVLIGNRRVTYRNSLIKQLDPVITVTVNSLGFRGPDPPPDFDRHLTILAVGGSTTLCFMLSDGKTWPDRLGRRLDGAFREVWINNAGLAGHSTRAHEILLEDRVAPLHPKVVLFLVGLNDVGVARLGRGEAEQVKTRVMFDSARSLVKSLSPRSEVATLLGNLYRSWTAYQPGLRDSFVDLTKVDHFEASAESRRQFIERYSGSYLPGYELRLKRLVDRSRRAQIEPVFVTQPLLVGRAIDDVTRVDLGTIYLTSWGNTHPNGETWWDLMETYNDVTRKVGRENNVLVIDAARLLPKSSRYFYDISHFTNEGAQMLADLIYNFLCPMLAERFGTYVQRPCECWPAGLERARACP